MPRISDQPVHRLHIMVDEADHQWLKQTLGGEKAISSVFRSVIRRLRGLKTQNPDTSVEDLFQEIEPYRSHTNGSDDQSISSSAKKGGTS